MRLLTRFLFALSLMTVAGQSFSAQWSGPTDSELKMLPPYCTAKLKNDPALIQIYQPEIGPQFGSIHHYCFALNFMNRYYRTTGPERGSWLHFALDDFNYMLKGPDPKSPITPEIYLNRGIALRLAHRDAEAARDYYKAIELDPKQARAYSELADYFADNRLTAKALEIVTQGLRHLPDNKALQRRYTKYGGKLPYPKPIDQEESKPTVQSQETSPGPERPTPVAEEKQKIGIPSNPWCRFCPE